MNGINREYFKNPTVNPDCSLSCFWFWNDAITDKKTAEQLDMMHRIHLSQPIVHARFGLKNEYLSADWFERIKSAVGTAKKNGQKIWLYDENNWPSGNCDWTITRDEKYREHFLQFEETCIGKDESFTLDISAKNYVNITAYFSDESTADLLDGAAGGKINYTAPADAEIYAVYVAADPYEAEGKFSVDYLSREAIAKFIESTHEKYKEHFADEFGRTIRGIFMDETRFCNAMPWTETLPVEFKKRKGYDIIPYLPLLIRSSEQSKLFRFDYYDVISDMYAEATFKQVYDWCEKNSLLTTGHLLGEETIAAQSYFGADMLRAFKYFHVPGIDHLGNGIGSLDAKFVVGACRHYGKETIACEAFGASGWDMNYEDMVRISNWLFQQGINIIMMHGFYYSIRDERANDFPPSYFYQWKYWDKMPEYALMANRMSEMLSGGRAEAEILVYNPIESFWNHYKPDLCIKTGFWSEGPWIKDDTAKHIDKQFQLLCNTLTDENLDYEIFGADASDCFSVEGKSLVNLHTGALYSVFVLPCASVLTENVVRLLDAFTENGGIAISYQSAVETVVTKDGRHMRGETIAPPCSGRFIPAKRIADVAVLCREKLSLPFEIVSGPDKMKHSKMSYPARLIDPYIHDGERVWGVGVTRYLKDGARIFNITNYNEMDEDLVVWVRSDTEPEIFVPETGEIFAATIACNCGNGYEISVTIPQNRSYFVICNKKRT